MGGLLSWHAPSLHVRLAAAVWRLVHLPDLPWRPQEESEGRQGHLQPHASCRSSRSFLKPGILCVPALAGNEGLPGMFHTGGSLPQAPLPATLAPLLPAADLVGSTQQCGILTAQMHPHLLYFSMLTHAICHDNHPEPSTKNLIGPSAETQPPWYGHGYGGAPL